MGVRRGPRLQTPRLRLHVVPNAGRLVQPLPTMPSSYRHTPALQQQLYSMNRR